MEPETLYDLFADIKRIENVINFMDDKAYSVYGILIEPSLKNIKSELEKEELKD